jgi:hypothetical protein
LLSETKEHENEEAVNGEDVEEETKVVDETGQQRKKMAQEIYHDDEIPKDKRLRSGVEKDSP